MSAGEILIEAGITMIEVPLNSPQPFESIRQLADACEARITIGAGTVLPPECFRTLRQRADVRKLFPGAMVGPEGLKAIRAVLPESTRVYAVGGAGPENFREWMAAGVDGFGLGSALYHAGDTMENLAEKAQRMVDAFDSVVWCNESTSPRPFSFPTAGRWHHRSGSGHSRVSG